MTDDTRELIEEARRFDTVPAEYAVRLLGSHSLIRRLADALEASLPTEDDREALAKALFDADAPVVGYERRYPDEGNEDVQTGQEWRYYLPMADRLAAGFRRSPVPPETDAGMDINEIEGDVNQRVPATDFKDRSHVRALLKEVKRLRSRAAVPPGVLACTVDESGGMVEIQAAKDLLSAAYGPGEWAVPPERDEAIGELVDAIRLTVEYIGNGWLPPIKGWSWFDALVKYAPEVADEFKRNPIHPVASVPPVTEETVTTVEELDALPVGTVVEDAFAATCIKTEGDRAVLGWHRVTSAVERGCHWHYPFVPARVLYRPDTEGDNRG